MYRASLPRSRHLLCSQYLTATRAMATTSTLPLWCQVEYVKRAISRENDAGTFRCRMPSTSEKEQALNKMVSKKCNTAYATINECTSALQSSGMKGQTDKLINGIHTGQEGMCIEDSHHKV